MDKVIQQLKELNSIKPRKDWVEQNKVQLMSQLQAQKVQKQKSIFSYWYLLKMLVPFRVLNFMAKPIGVVFLVLLMVVSTGILTVSASRNTIPGDTLYSVKLTSERVKVSFAVSDENESKVHIQNAQERVRELEQVVKEENAPEVKKEKIKIVTENLQKNIESANKSLEKVKITKQEKEKTEKVLAVIKEVDQKTKEIKSKLKEQKEKVNNELDKESVKKLASVISAVEGTSVKATEVMVEKYDSGEAEIDSSEVVKAVEEQIQVVTEKLKTVTDNQKLIEEADEVEKEEAEIEVNSEEEEVQSNEVEGEVEVEETEEVEAGDDTATEVKIESEETEGETIVVEDTSQNAQIILDEAQELLNQGDMKQALEKITQVNEMTTKVELDIEDDVVVESQEEDTRKEEEGQESEDVGSETEIEVEEVTEVE